jgi:chloramphenicol-sensitive protein RarD
VTACAIWGFAPLYYHHLSEVAAPEMMAHRTIWTALCFGLVVLLAGRWNEVRALLTGADRWRIIAAALLIGFNWSLFIWAVVSGHAVEASLGYYIYPLVSAILGVVIFAERLAGLQALGVAAAALAVGVLTYGLGVAPVVSLALAVSFALYAVVKKRIAAPALISVLAEVLIIAPPLLALLIWLAVGAAAPVWVGQGWFGRDLYHSLMLPLAGPLSGGPLILFSYGAQRVRLATSGLTQYLNPTLQFFSAWLILAEPVTLWHGLALALIWTAIGLYALGRR